MMSVRRLFLIFTGIVLPLTIAGAQELPGFKKHDVNAPIDWSADRMEVQSQAQRVLFTGSVIAKQAELTLDADRVTVAYRNEAGLHVDSIVAAGNVTVQNPSERATGGFAVYDLNRRLVTLIGEVVLTEEKGVVRGDRLVLDLDTGHATLTGRRVAGTFKVSNSTH